MNMLAIDSVARDFVDAVTPLLGSSGVAVMDTEGSILASSYPERVGNIHYGAVEAAKRRQVVHVRSGDSQIYPGALEGICLPVIKRGELLGVVAVQGNPDEMDKTAGLLAACVGLCLDMTHRENSTRQSKDLRVALLRAIISGAEPDAENILERGRELGLDLRLPARIIAFTPLSADSLAHASGTLARVERIFAFGACPDSPHDLSETLDGSLVVFKHIPEGFDVGAFASGLHAALSREIALDIGVGIGRLCTEWNHLAVSRHEAGMLSEIGGGIRSIDDPNGKMHYMLRGSLDFGISAKYLALLEADLKRGIGGKDYCQVMQTVRAYCDADCHGGRAAENLGIHKNTMNYRMNKIVSLLGLDRQNAFVREFFLRLLALQGGDKPTAK